MFKFFKEYGVSFNNLTFKIGVLYILIYMCIKTLEFYIYVHVYKHVMRLEPYVLSV